MKETWVVTRQRQYPDGDLCVEITYGGFDYTNPGELVTKYDGEGEEYADPREAVEVGIRIALAWQEETRKEVFIGKGFTGGDTLAMNLYSLTPYTFREFREWAEEKWESLPKCAHCGEIIQEKWTLPYCDDEFCSQYCCELALEYMQDDEEDAETEEESGVPALSGIGVFVTRIATSQKEPA